MSLESAIGALEMEQESLQRRSRVIGDDAWLLLQAKSLGLTFLRSLAAKGLNEPATIEYARKVLRGEVVETASTLNS